ncbi:MAG: hypothetical protein Tsb0020_33800 [Haliangiales bacterium]
MYQRPTPRSPNAIAKPYRFLRLPLDVDVTALADELARVRVPWAESQWKWHLETRFCVLRAGADESYPGGTLVSGAGVDAPILAQLPALKAALDTLAPAPARLAWLGLSPPGARIFLHRDNTHHWDEHHRLHIPIVTNPDARLCVDGHFVHMPAGSVWAFNNSHPHGAINRGAADRVHLMIDVPPTPAVEALFAAGTAEPGALDREALADLGRDPLKLLHKGHLADLALIQRLLAQ